MPTGAASGLLVVDIDSRNGGDKSLDELEAKHGQLPKTAEQITGGGGRHIIYRHSGGAVPKRSPGQKLVICIAAPSNVRPIIRWRS